MIYWNILSHTLHPPYYALTEATEGVCLSAVMTKEAASVNLARPLAVHAGQLGETSLDLFKWIDRLSNSIYSVGDRYSSCGGHVSHVPHIHYTAASVVSQLGYGFCNMKPRLQNGDMKLERFPDGEVSKEETQLCRIKRKFTCTSDKNQEISAVLWSFWGQLYETAFQRKWARWAISEWMNSSWS